MPPNDPTGGGRGEADLLSIVAHLMQQQQQQMQQQFAELMARLTPATPPTGQPTSGPVGSNSGTDGTQRPQPTPPPTASGSASAAAAAPPPGLGAAGTPDPVSIEAMIQRTVYSALAASSGGVMLGAVVARKRYSERLLETRGRSFCVDQGEAAKLMVVNRHNAVSAAVAAAAKQQVQFYHQKANVVGHWPSTYFKNLDRLMVFYPTDERGYFDVAVAGLHLQENEFSQFHDAEYRRCQEAGADYLVGSADINRGCVRRLMEFVLERYEPAEDNKREAIEAAFRALEQQQGESVASLASRFTTLCSEMLDVDPGRPQPRQRPPEGGRALRPYRTGPTPPPRDASPRPKGQAV